MDKVTGELTVFFEEPFWVGVFERVENGKLSVCKVTFGAEPKDYEIWEFILKNYYNLKFSPAVDIAVKKESKNPKRLQRSKEARKQTAQTGIGTKSQQALQLQREKNKLERKKLSKEKKEAEKQRQFELKQQKRKRKLRGR